MNLSSLRTFLAIVETGSLVRASQTLNVTQSTVTTRLKTLEAELGQSLIHRNRTPVTLTSAGLKFKRYAEAISDLWQQARQETSLPAGVDQMCNLGCHMDLWPTMGRRLFDEFRNRHGNAAVSAWPGEQAQLDQWLGTGLVDVALSYRVATHENQVTHTLQAESLVLVSTDRHGPIRFDPGYIYVDAGEDFARRHAAAYADAGIAKLSFGSAVWGLEYLLANGGSAYLPERLVRAHCAAGRLHVREQAPVFNRNVYLITNDALAGDWSWLPEVMQGA